MGRERKTYNDEFKIEVAIEALRERKTVNEIASSYGISPSMVTKWKKEFLDNKRGTAREKELEKENMRLKEERDAAYLEVGKQKLMINLMEKKLNLPD